MLSCRLTYDFTEYLLPHLLRGSALVLRAGAGCVCLMAEHEHTGAKPESSGGGDVEVKVTATRFGQWHWRRL